jgi:spore germination protein
MVQPGDTLWAIATTYGVPVDRIVAANGIVDPDRLAPGEILLIPKP